MTANQSTKKASKPTHVKKKGKSDNPKNGQSTRPLVDKMTALYFDFQNHRKAHRKAIRADIVAAVEIGLEMQNDPEQWAYFCENCWKENPPKVSQIDKAVKFAIMYMVGASRSGRSKASFYYSAVKLSVDSGIRGEELKQVLKAEGLANLRKKHTEHKKNMKSSSPVEKSGCTVSEKPTKNPITKKASGGDKVTSTKQGVNERNEKLKGQKHEWSALLSFDDKKNRMTNLKEGLKVRITAEVDAIGQTLRLVVSKMKIVREEL
ncbi:hypothetical protein HRR99_17950 [Agrobacterium vaccinii]|uniref:hypothetical protein n=1 Tax=Agrobacterium vaccinii TaxID=2735528 RepID=UPI001E656FE8|nr:hypothetical protein [Agrobacterium vaccinii]UHS63460.1 hypothetical protein HRR99_17950 [Agrobacterium vaccinii]